MFCTNCGNKMDSDALFCVNCGKGCQFDGNMELPKFNKQMSRKWIVCILVILMVLAILIAFICFYRRNTSYKACLDKYFKAIETADGRLWREVIADEYIVDLIDDWGYTEEYLLETYQESLEEGLEDLVKEVGPNIKITYEIIYTYEPTKLELADLNEWMEDDGFENGEIKDAIVVNCNYRISGKFASGTKNTTLLLIKVHGKWYRAVGYIDLSWYEQ